jgi:hypothetical protein
MATKLSEIYRQHQAKKLMDVRVSLLEKGVYPFDALLKEHGQTINTAEKIEILEGIGETFKASVPTLYMFIKANTNTLLESKTNLGAVESAMVNYAFVSEALGKCVKEAAKIFAEKHEADKTLAVLYRKDAVELLEFCIKRSETHKLMEGDTSMVIRHLATELAGLPISSLVQLCESVPTIPLYLSRKNHDTLAHSILQNL